MGELADFLSTHDSNFRKARLPALYSDFRSQTTLNPDGFRANIASWTHALSLLASRGLLSKRSSHADILILNLDDSILRALESRQYGQPLALGAVIRESVANKDILPLRSFLDAQQNVFQKTWGQVPWDVMGWTLRQLGITDSTRGEDKLPKGQYVLIENVLSASKAFDLIMSDKPSRFDRVFTKSQFYQTFYTDLINGQRLSEADMDVLLHYLSRDKGTIEYDGKIIRVRATGEPDSIAEEDVAIASVKDLALKLKYQTDILNARIDELEIEAKRAVSRKNRVAALAALKSKKQAEASLSQRYASLNQLEEVASKIEQAADNVQLVKVMESSTSVLKSLNTQVGGVDKVDAVMDQLRDHMNDTEELSNILAEPAAPVDEGEIDDELEAMEQEEKQKLQEKEAREAELSLGKLPPLPSEEMVQDKDRAKTPTSETGIGNLSLGERT